MGFSNTLLQLPMKPVYAMYREAKNTTSYFYKFLCYFKILEGLLGKMNADIHRNAKKHSVSLQVVKLIVPDHPELPEQYKVYVGKQIKYFFDSVLTPQFRQAAAHFITNKGEVLDMSDPRHVRRFSTVTLILELCVRAAIENHEKLLGNLTARLKEKARR
jgi:hypothetical protein